MPHHLFSIDDFEQGLLASLGVEVSSSQVSTDELNALIQRAEAGLNTVGNPLLASFAGQLVGSLQAKLATRH
jgi:hypothetical protein